MFMNVHPSFLFVTCWSMLVPVFRMSQRIGTDGLTIRRTCNFMIEVLQYFSICIQFNWVQFLSITLYELLVQILSVCYFVFAVSPSLVFCLSIVNNWGQHPQEKSLIWMVNRFDISAEAGLKSWQISLVLGPVAEDLSREF